MEDRTALRQDHRMDSAVRLALAQRAYDNGTVRVVATDLAGCDHLVGTRHGLFAVGIGTCRLIAHGLYYGLTVRDDMIHAFEACDRPRHPTQRGRIVRFRRDGMRIVGAEVVATGLDNGCHQIDWIDGRLCVVDTYNQRVLRYAVEGGAPDILHPVEAGGDGDWAAGYAHINSLIAVGDTILLLLHNGGDRTRRPSEIARFDRDWRPIDRMPLGGMGCHGLAVLEDGTILSCGSLAGELVSTGGLKMPVCDLMTRGLAVGDDAVVVGGSTFSPRALRDDACGAIFFLDRAYRRRAVLPMPAMPMEIRRIDGRDRSLSTHLAAIAG